MQVHQTLSDHDAPQAVKDKHSEHVRKKYKRIFGFIYSGSVFLFIFALFLLVSAIQKDGIFFDSIAQAVILNIFTSIVLVISTWAWFQINRHGFSISTLFTKDLNYVGLIDDSDFDAAGASMWYIRLTVPKVTSPSSRVRAFLNYGFYSKFKEMRSSTPVLSFEDKTFDSGAYYEQQNLKLLQTLVFESIGEASKLNKKLALNSSVNPIPLAAYLLRVSSFKNNPADKSMQEKAFWMWSEGRSLELAFKTREYSLEEISAYSALPDTWIVETLALVNPLPDKPIFLEGR